MERMASLRFMIIVVANQLLMLASRESFLVFGCLKGSERFVLLCIIIAGERSRTLSANKKQCCMQKLLRKE